MIAHAFNLHELVVQEESLIVEDYLSDPELHRHLVERRSAPQIQDGDCQTVKSRASGGPQSGAPKLVASAEQEGLSDGSVARTCQGQVANNAGQGFILLVVAGNGHGADLGANLQCDLLSPGIDNLHRRQHLRSLCPSAAIADGARDTGRGIDAPGRDVHLISFVQPDMAVNATALIPPTLCMRRIAVNGKHVFRTLSKPGRLAQVIIEGGVARGMAAQKHAIEVGLTVAVDTVKLDPHRGVLPHLR
mmetsp:Transcript_108634/g.232049  ORF Transcript_108634/g.232049 Transcript_108634/m.232049 type:complete len:247 (-) Transcript_108634:312-1052(-)